MIKDIHCKISSKLSDIILGGQDGMVNVLGVILGVAAASDDFHIVIVAGLAATFAESISMAAVGYTSTKADKEYYQSQWEREQWKIDHIPDKEIEKIVAIYRNRGFGGKLLQDVVATITSNKKVWTEVMMQEELNLSKVDDSKPLISSMLIGASTLVGSFIPLIPFFLFSIDNAIPISLIISALTLFVVGYYKAQTMVGNIYRSGFELMTIGIVSALVGYAVGLTLKVPPTI